jgi:hypothetical protein
LSLFSFFYKEKKMELPQEILLIIREYASPTGRMEIKRRESEQILRYRRKLRINQRIVGGPNESIDSFYELWRQYKIYHF